MSWSMGDCLHGKGNTACYSVTRRVKRKPWESPGLSYRLGEIMSESNSDIYVSTGAFKGETLEAILDIAIREGVRNVELSSGVPYTPTILETVHNYSDRLNFMVHNYFPPPAEPFVLNLAAADEKIRKRSIEHAIGAIELSAELSSSAYSIHAGFLTSPEPNELGKPFNETGAISRAHGLDLFLDSLKQVLSFSEGTGVDLLVENNVAASFNCPNGENTYLLGVDADELVHIAECVDSSAFGLLIDTGHLKVSARALGFDEADFIRTTSPWIRGWHLSDNDGTSDSNMPFDERAWFIPFLAENTGTYRVIEAYGINGAQLSNCYRAIS